MSVQTPEMLYRHSARGLAKPDKVEPHPPVASMAPFTCATCNHEYALHPTDTVHWVERTCRCGSKVEAPWFLCDSCKAEEAERVERERQSRLAVRTDSPIDTAEPETPEQAERRREGSNPLYAMAKAYVMAYTGDFEFLLDMKRRIAGQRGERGPLTDRQVEAILKCRQAELDRAKRAEEAAKARVQTGRDLTQLPEGRTCAAVDNESGTVTFLLIDRPKAGTKWAGWVFVKQQQGPNEVRLGAQRPGESYVGQWANLIDKVLADPVAAVARYGLELGVCGVCNRALTNDISREAGIGPVCRAKLENGF